jgi:hypothetical protein
MYVQDIPAGPHAQAQIFATLAIIAIMENVKTSLI